MPVTSPGKSSTRSGFDQVDGFQYRNANRSIAMNNGENKPPAVTGSITNDKSGIPMMENPPPKAPFINEITNTPVKATRIVTNVSSGVIKADESIMASSPD